LSGNLIVQVGKVTEGSQPRLVRAQHRRRVTVATATREAFSHSLDAATLDGMVEEIGFRS
jgi:hypothetical protein